MRRILRFTASWCAPCKALAQILETANSEKNMPIEVIDIEEQTELAVQYGIRTVPTMVMLEENIEVRRMTGVKAENLIREWIND